MDISKLQKARYDYKPKMPRILLDDITNIKTYDEEPTQSIGDQEQIKKLFPHTYGMSEVAIRKGKDKQIGKEINIGVILSGGQAPGGHNVIAGLYDAMHKSNLDSHLIGFKEGPRGILEDRWMEITSPLLEYYRNTGGFDIIGSGRDKIETQEQIAQCEKVLLKHEISALVIIGGDDSNTNAAILAEQFASHKVPVQVIGCPKTIDGDLRNDKVELPFGFDTATKTYTELVGNIERDANSSRKYWHFIKLMGRSASHIALECGLECQPNITLIGEEIQAKKMTFKSVIEHIADVVSIRASHGNNFGVVLVPEGIIEFIPEFQSLIKEMNERLAQKESEISTLSTIKQRIEFVSKLLTPEHQKVFALLPDFVQQELVMDRDPHGNVPVAKIETEKLIANMVAAEMKKRKKAGTFSGSFNYQTHYFGYEGRCAFPSNFDANYCYSLGYTSFVLIACGLSGYMACIGNLHDYVDNWQPGGVPFTMMMDMEERKGVMKPVIRKALVDLQGIPFKFFKEHRAQWEIETCYNNPGPIQYWGPENITDRPTKTVWLEQMHHE